MDKIKKAVLGLLLILSSFLILQIINPELTILKAPWIDQPEKTSTSIIDPSSPIDIPITTFTVQKEGGLKEESIGIIPDEKVTFAWNIPGGQGCKASNTGGLDSESNKWNGDIKNSGDIKLSITIDDTGEYRFNITCRIQNSYFSKDVFIAVNSSGFQDDPGNLSVRLKAIEKEKSNIYSYDSIEWKGTKITFDWSEFTGFLNDDECTFFNPDGFELFTAIISDVRIYGRSTFAASQGLYKIQCTNKDSRASKSDEIRVWYK